MSVFPWEKTAAGNLAECGYVLVRDLHYGTVMVAILVVQAKMFLGGLNVVTPTESIGLTESVYPYVMAPWWNCAGRAIPWPRLTCLSDRDDSEGKIRSIFCDVRGRGDLRQSA